ncbi:MAG: outer membrane lipoprotein-sorting protein [Chthoniobacterales bacterium]
MGDGLLESDLAYQDAVENFFAWKSQSLVGTETIDRVSCQILESKPDSSSQTIYGKVRSWIDLRRMVPMRVEKYSPSGKLIRRIDTDRVMPDDQHRQIPARLIVHGPRKNTVTELNGSGIKHDVSLTDADFTPSSILR